MKKLSLVPVVPFMLVFLFVTVCAANEGFMLADYEFTDAGGKTVHFLSDAENGLFFKASIMNQDVSENLDISVIMAVYDGERLAQISCDEDSIYPCFKSKDISVGFDALPKTENAPAVKVFLWDKRNIPQNLPIELNRTDYKEIYVEAGSENGDGSQNKPFSDITEARDYIRAHPDKAFVVNIKGGSYYHEKEIIFDERDKRTAEAPVIYIACENERPVLIGGKSLDLKDFTVAEDNRIPEGAKGSVLKLDLSGYKLTFPETMPAYGHSQTYLTQYGISHSTSPYFELMADDKLMTNARWPNEGYAVVSEITDAGSMEEKRGFSFKLGDDGKIKKWENAEKMCIQGYWKYDYSDLSMPATADFENGVITAAYPSGQGVAKNRRFFVYNLLEELDAPCEWYIDEKTETLYFYPPESCEKLSLITQPNSMLRLAGISNTVFKGIDILGTLGRGINAANCENVTVDSIKLSGAALWGIYFDASKNCTVKNSVINGTGFGGVYVSGGSFTEKLVGENRIINNDISDYSVRKKCYSPGINLGGYKNLAINNAIHDAPQQALSMGGNYNALAYNEIYRVASETSDMGAFYARQSKTSRGNLICNNFFHSLESNSQISASDIQAVYLDDLLDAYTVRYNVFADIKGTGVTVSGGRENTVTDNVFINVDENAEVRGVGTEYPSKYTSYINDLCEKIKSGYYPAEIYGKYPRFMTLPDDEPLFVKYNIYKNNLTCNEKYDTVFSACTVCTEFYIINNNEIEASVVLSESDFKDFEGKNYTPVRKLPENFIAPDFENMGIRQN